MLIELRNVRTSLLAAELCMRVIEHDRSANGAVMGIFALLTRMAAQMRDEERFLLADSLRDAADVLERVRECARV